ncbi:response regulator receiver protein [Candidatus Magnetoovum chiemensis]|nr:response regulator receiver protein [Candidatus Magnetoovum chiemensis]
MLPHKILIVEDNENNRRLLRDLLNFYGYETIEAENGKEGLEIAKKHKPSLIMMDIQMPIMDGITAAKLIRKDPHIGQTKLIAVTALAMKEERERILEAGFDDYITKPINTRQIPTIISKYLK